MHNTQHTSNLGRWSALKLRDKCKKKPNTRPEKKLRKPSDKPSQKLRDKHVKRLSAKPGKRRRK